MSRRNLAAIIAVCIVVIIVAVVIRTQAELPTLDDPVVTFAAPNLEAAIRETLNLQGDIHASKLADLTSLSVSGREIENLAGLEHCHNLTLLSLRSNLIEHISPLDNLTGLTELVLSYNQISDISPLADLTSLTT